MIIIKTYNEHHYERGLIECESIEFYDKNSLICIDVKCVYGAADIIQYVHFHSCTHIVIPSRDLLHAKAA